MPIRALLTPVDFSAASEDALRYAVSLAAKLGAERVHVLHVHQAPTVPLADGAAEMDGAADVKRRAARELEGVCKRYSAHDTEVVPHFVEGVPYEAIVGEATRLGADLIVMGTHGRSGFAHLVLGSIAERVVRSSPVPVCTVRAPKA